MELNSDSIHDIVHPTSAFSCRPAFQPPVDSAVPWQESRLNPKNRTDSLSPPLKPLWRIDGSSGSGTQFYVLPLFLEDVPPMRFDVFVPEETSQDPYLRKLLDLDLAFHTKDKERVRRLAISNLILRRLQLWSETTEEGSPASVARFHTTLPFGTRIVFRNLHVDLHQIEITLEPGYSVERQFVALGQLRETLRLPEDVSLPYAVDIADLSHVEQLHDSVCTVRFNASGRQNHQNLGRKLEVHWVFKALTSDTKFMYSELRVLLLMPKHVSVMAAPDFLVTKRGNFGNKLGVVGFLLALHSGGSLRDVVPMLRLNGRLTLELQMRWALQLTSAVSHIRARGKIFYPDFRLDNIVVSSSGDAVMVDFEQRGVWCEFGAPEVNALDYCKLLASDTARDKNDANISEHVRKRFADMLSQNLPDWQAIVQSEKYETLPHHYTAYNIPWLCLDEREQEACEVYMLGRVLWCIFEGQSIPHTSAVWQSYRFEPDLEWPKFRFTPEPLRDIIDRCTRGRRPAMTTLIIRRGSKLVFRSDPPGTERDPNEILKVAREWWTAEVKFAEDFLAMRQKLKKLGQWTGNYYNRPTVNEVLTVLHDYACQHNCNGVIQDD